MNHNNFGYVNGNLTRDPMFFTNNDGSQKILFTVAAQNPYKSRDGERKAQFIQLQKYIAPGDSLGPFAYLSSGKHVQIDYEVRSFVTVDENGNEDYKQALEVQSITLGADSKKQQAQNQNAQTAQQTTQAPVDNNYNNAQAPQPQPQPVESKPLPSLDQNQQAPQAQKIQTQAPQPQETQPGITYAAPNNKGQLPF